MTFSVRKPSKRILTQKNSTYIFLSSITYIFVPRKILERKDSIENTSLVDFKLFDITDLFSCSAYSNSKETGINNAQDVGCIKQINKMLRKRVAYRPNTAASRLIGSANCINWF